jgi:uncharacterized membrane protein YadS
MRHLAAALTATAVATIAWFLSEQSGMGSSLKAATLVLSLILGTMLGMRLEHLGQGPDRTSRVIDWAVVAAGVLILGFAVFSVAIFFALFGSLVGLHAATVVAVVYLALRLALAERRRRVSERGRQA